MRGRGERMGGFEPGSLLRFFQFLERSLVEMYDGNGIL